MNRTASVKRVLKFGLILGLGFCLYTTFMWMTQLDTTYLNVGQYLDMAIIILPVSVIFLAIRHESKHYNITIWNRLSIAIFVGLVSFLIYDPFLYVYHNYINPDWFDSVLKLKEAELKNLNASPEVITQALEKLKASNLTQAGLFRLSALISSVVVLPVIIALLSMIFIRNKPQGKTPVGIASQKIERSGKQI